MRKSRKEVMRVLDNHGRSHPTEYHGGVLTTALLMNRVLGMADIVGADTRRGDWERNSEGEEDRTEKG